VGIALERSLVEFDPESRTVGTTRWPSSRWVGLSRISDRKAGLDQCQVRWNSRRSRLGIDATTWRFAASVTALCQLWGTQSIPSVRARSATRRVPLIPTTLASG